MFLGHCAADIYPRSVFFQDHIERILTIHYMHGREVDLLSIKDVASTMIGGNMQSLRLILDHYWLTCYITYKRIVY